jgi:oxygen-independent coproporphyrinogen III oxidase
LSACLDSDGAQHLYVHVPFCRARCAYCDFASEVLPAARKRRAALYVARLLEELKERRALLAPPLETIYVGGGTPTRLPPDQLLQLVQALGGLLAPVGEFTVEANPGTLDGPLLDRLRRSGVTRLSLGIQSFQAPSRRALGRRVSGREIEQAVAAVKQAGWEDWNLDLIFAIPGQDWDSARADLEAAVSTGAPHLSLYDLSYSETYAAWLAARYGPSARSDAESFAEEHYQRAVAFLEAFGYKRYEVSNFAQRGHECRHNLAYWRGCDYVGLGASAVSTIGGNRWANPPAVADHLARRPPEHEGLSPGTKMFERAMLGLRTAEGVDRGSVEAMLEGEALKMVEQRGYARERYGRLSLSPRGMNLANAVLAAILRSDETTETSRSSRLP